MTLRRRLHRLYRHIVFRENALWVWGLYLKHKVEHAQVTRHDHSTPKT